MQDANEFRDMYSFTFQFAVNLVNEGKKVLPIDAAISMWDIFFGKNKCNFLKRYSEFLKGKEAKNPNFAISKDEWEVFFILVKET
jgi:hypothetical protein